jgi:hypothetical protein
VDNLEQCRRVRKQDGHEIPGVNSEDLARLQGNRIGRAFPAIQGSDLEVDVSNAEENSAPLLCHRHWCW